MGLKFPWKIPLKIQLAALGAFLCCRQSAIEPAAVKDNGESGRAGIEARIELVMLRTM